jgi:hypothetical protein
MVAAGDIRLAARHSVDLCRRAEAQEGYRGASLAYRGARDAKTSATAETRRGGA